MNNEDFYISLIYKQLEQPLSDEEAQLLEQWLAASPENQGLADDLTSVYAESEDYLADEVANVDVEAAFEAQMQLIHLEEQKEQIAQKGNKEVQTPAAPLRVITNNTNSRQKTIRASKGRIQRRNFLSIAASVAILLVAGWWWFSHSNNDNPNVTAFNNGDGAVNEYQLSDGSVVTLDRGATVVFPKAFGDDERVVQLKKGQATFDVAKNQGTFRVETPTGRAEVLGTIFTLNEDTIQNALRLKVAEGKVRLKSENQSLKMIATQGEEIVLKDGGMYKTRYNNQQQQNYFEFNNVELSIILATLSAYWGEDLDLPQLVDKDLSCTMTVTFDNETPTTIVTILTKLKSTCIE